jgi:hypothetical protein
MAASLTEYTKQPESDDGGTVFEHPSLQPGDDVEVVPIEAQCCGAIGCERGEQLLQVRTPAGERVFCTPHGVGYLNREGYLG